MKKIVIERKIFILAIVSLVMIFGSLCVVIGVQNNLINTQEGYIKSLKEQVDHSLTNRL